MAATIPQHIFVLVYGAMNILTNQAEAHQFVTLACMILNYLNTVFINTEFSEDQASEAFYLF